VSEGFHRRAPGAASGQLSLWSTEPADRDWRVRVSERARRMSIRVFAGGRVEIVAPPSARSRVIERFVRQHRDWIDRKVSELRTQAPPAWRLPERVDFRAGGISREVVYRASAGRPRLVSSQDALVIEGDPGDAAAVRETLRRWLMPEARQLLEPWLERTAREVDIDFERMQIRRQRTRWGSCSRQGTISLNCCLVFQSPAVVRYLLVHELCHRRHMNHSQRFWRLVATHEPDYRRLDRELVLGWQHVPAWVFVS
jgi:predicted metal-dependent hydrolase